MTDTPPLADLSTENHMLRARLAALEAVAQRIDASWTAYVEAHAGRGHVGQEHTRESIFEGGCGLCESAMYGTEVEMDEYVIPAIRGLLAKEGRSE